MNPNPILRCSKSSKKDELFKIQQGGVGRFSRREGEESDAGAGDEQRDDEEEEEEEKNYDEKDDGEDVEE